MKELYAVAKRYSFPDNFLECTRKIGQTHGLGLDLVSYDRWIHRFVSNEVVIM